MSVDFVGFIFSLFGIFYTKKKKIIFQHIVSFKQISEQKLNTTRILRMANEHQSDHSNIDEEKLDAIIVDCGSSKDSILDTCQKIAPLMHCLSTNLHEQCHKPNSE